MQLAEITRPHILYIDDDKELTSLLSEYLTEEGYDLTVCHDGELGLATATSDRYFDVILLDVMLPLINGFEVLKALRHTNFAPVILLTAKSDEFDRVFGLELGADDYLPKPFSTRELQARINAQIRRTQFNKQHAVRSSLHIGPFIFDNKRQNLSFKKTTVALTSTEYSIVQLLALQSGQKVSKSAISQKVFGKPLAPYDRSIDMHISNIRKKLAVFTSLETIRTVRPQGYMLVDVWPS